MQSGSINQPPKKSVQHQRPTTGTDSVREKGNAQQAAPGAVEQQEAPAAEPAESVAFAAVMDVTPDALRMKDDGQGGYESEMTLAFVKKTDRERLEKDGAIFPEVGQAVLGDGIGADGSLEVVSNYDTENPKTKSVGASIEVDSSLLEVNPETGEAPISTHTPIFLAQGEGVLPSDSKAVPKDSQVIPEGYMGTLGTSRAGQKTESKRILANNLTKTLGTFSGSSLAGFPLPLIGNYAPILALGSAGFAFNQNMETRKNVQDQLGYLEQQEKKSTNDVVPMADEMLGGTYNVSAKAHRKRLETQLRQANLQLGSTGLLAAAGATSIVGSLAGAGVAGFAGMAGVAAATPFLAGASVLLGNGTMVFNSLASLKELSKERAELMEKQKNGETHVDQTVEYMNQITDPSTGKVVAKRPEVLGDKPVQIPIEERLKAISKEQRTHRFLATAFSGSAVTVGSMLTGIGSMAVVGPLSLAPAAAVGGVQSAIRLKQLAGEKKDLLEAQKNGETMLEQNIQQADGTWGKERVPISTLLDVNRKEANKHKLIITAAGTFGAVAGATLGAGLSLVAASPLLLVPLAVGAVLFPDKVKKFAGKVMDLIKGTVGELGRSARDVGKKTGEEAEKFGSRIDEKLAGLAESNPELFAPRVNSRIPFKKDQPGGYFTELKALATEYAKADNQMERHEVLRTINQWMERAPDDAKPGLAAFHEEMTGLSMEVEAQWLARDIQLEMKTPITDKVVKDDRVKSRIQELKFPTDTIRDQYEESLYIENSQQKSNELVTASQSGDIDASRKLARAEVFKAARILAIKERDLGVDLYARYMDAIQRPEDEDNLELLMKEVGYRQDVAVTGEEIELVSAAQNTLNTPLQLAPENPQLQVQKLNTAVASMRQADPEAAESLLETDSKISNPETFKGMNAQEALAERTKLNAVYQAARRSLRKSAPEALATYQEADQKLKTMANSPESPVTAAPVMLKGPEARMENAFRSLSKQQPELSKELGEAFSKLLNPLEYRGMSEQEVKAAKVANNLELQKVRKKLAKKEPELMKLWDGARQEVEKAYFDRSVDHQLKDAVLANDEVTAAAKELGFSKEETEKLYMSLAKVMILEDRRDLETQLMGDNGETDKKSAEMLAVIDRSLLRESAKRTNGGADFEPPEKVAPLQDKSVQGFLNQNPQVGQVLNSEAFATLAQNMGIPPEEVLNAYLTRVQAELNPVLAAEFNGRLEGGDMSAKRTLDISNHVIGLIQQATRPTAEVLEQQVAQTMQGIVVQTVLQDPETAKRAEALGVNAEETMKLYLRAELSGDTSELASLEQQKQKGVTAAGNQLELVTEFATDVAALMRQVEAQSQQGGPVAQPAPEAA